jgi:mannosylfructose-6-phosphate phosphatase
MGTRHVVVADVDGTLVGDDTALEQFAAWHAGNRDRYRLVYATGRHRPSLAHLIATSALPEPDAVISAVGTEIHDREGHRLPGWLEQFGDWDAGAVRAALAGFPRLVPQPDANQTRLKTSFDVDGLAPADLAAIQAALRVAGLDARLVYSAARHLDILPAGAGKGNAARFTVDAWRVPVEQVMVFGDSGNDIDLFCCGFRGTLVANALPELKAAVGSRAYLASQPYAAGVLDGIRHWSAD